MRQYLKILFLSKIALSIQSTSGINNNGEETRFLRRKRAEQKLLRIWVDGEQRRESVEERDYYVEEAVQETETKYVSDFKTPRVHQLPIRQLADQPQQRLSSFEPPHSSSSTQTYYHHQGQQPLNAAYLHNDNQVQVTTSTEMPSNSARVYSNISLGLRIFILLLVVIAMILIMTAPGVCFWRTINGQQTSREVCPPSNSLFPMNIDRWDSAIHFQDRGKRIWGQLAIIILSILIALPPLVFSCIHFTSGRSYIYTQATASLIGLIAFLIFGSLETWYATGFDWMPAFIRSIGGGVFSGCVGIPACDTGFVVKGWAAAAAFYFFCALFYTVDLFVVYARKDK